MATTIADILKPGDDVDMAALARYLASEAGKVAAILIAQAVGLKGYATKALQDTDAAIAEGQLTYVYNNGGSATDPANTIYQRVGGQSVVATWFYNGMAAIVAPLVAAAQAARTGAEAARDAAGAFVAALQYLTAVLKDETVADDLLSIVIGDRLYATLTEAAGVTLYKAVLAAAGTRLDDQPGVLLADRVFSAALGPLFQPGNPMSGTILEMLATYPGDDTRLLGEIRTDGSWYLPRQTLSAAATLEDQPGVPLVARLGGTFTLDDSADYVLLATIDGAGNQQLRTRRKSDGRVAIITSTGSNTSPRLTADGRVVYLSSLTGLTQRVADASEPARAIEPTTAILLLGDSMIENGDAGIGEELTAAYPGRPVISQGIGGQWTQLAAARIGAEPVAVTVQGGSIPTSGSVIIVPDVDFLRIGQDGQDIVCRATIAGVAGTVLRNGPTAAAVYRFTPSVYPGAGVSVTGAVPMIVTSATARGTTDATNATSMEVMRGGTLILRLGKNDGDRPDFNLAAYIARIRAIVLRMTPLWRQVIVLGVTNGMGQVPTSAAGGMNATISPANSRLSLQRIADINAALKAAFPDNFIEPLAAHFAAGGTTPVTVDGATFDVLSAATAPDGTHEAQGAPQNRIVALIRDTMNTKGY